MYFSVIPTTTIKTPGARFPCSAYPPGLISCAVLHIPPPPPHLELVFFYTSPTHLVLISCAPHTPTPPHLVLISCVPHTPLPHSACSLCSTYPHHQCLFPAFHILPPTHLVLVSCILHTPTPTPSARFLYSAYSYPHT